MTYTNTSGLTANCSTHAHQIVTQSKFLFFRYCIYVQHKLLFRCYLTPIDLNRSSTITKNTTWFALNVIHLQCCTFQTFIRSAQTPWHITILLTPFTNLRYHVYKYSKSITYTHMHSYIPWLPSAQKLPSARN